MKQFPKREMDELIQGVRAWRRDEGNSSVHKPMTAAHKIGELTGINFMKWLNLIDAICAGLAPDAGNDTVYEVLRVLGWEPDTGGKKGLGNTFACTGERCPMQFGFDVKKCTAHDCQFRTRPITNADRFRAMSDEELVNLAVKQIGGGYDWIPCGILCGGKCECTSDDECRAKILKWLRQPVEVQHD